MYNVFATEALKHRVTRKIVREFNKELKVQECDARMFNRITEPDYPKIKTYKRVFRTIW
jgi:hypothetical protein